MNLNNLSLADLSLWVQYSRPLWNTQFPQFDNRREFSRSARPLVSMAPRLLDSDVTVRQWGMAMADSLAHHSHDDLLHFLSDVLRHIATTWPDGRDLSYEQVLHSLHTGIDMMTSPENEMTRQLLEPFTLAVQSLHEVNPTTWSEVCLHVTHVLRDSVNGRTADPALSPSVRENTLAQPAVFLAAAFEILAESSQILFGEGIVLDDWHSLVVAASEPQYNGRPFVNLDNAATTPPLTRVMDSINSLASLYSSVHRGSGIRSLVTTELYEAVRSKVKQFVGADPDYHEVIFVRNTTEALNILAHLASQQKDLHIITTAAEHHSNLLPWRRSDNVHIVPLDPMGQPEASAFYRVLESSPGGPLLVAMSGASNVTGHVVDLEELSRLTHHFGGQLAVDAAQLAPHRPIRMAHHGHIMIDFLALSGHKLYAPFGAGVLIAPKETLRRLNPLLIGGGSADLVTSNEIFLSHQESRHEAGSPNVFGVLALHAAINVIQDLGWAAILQHEHTLMHTLTQGLSAIPGITAFGNPDADRVGVVPFQVNDLPSDQVAAILAGEWNVAVRYGCFCAHPLVIHLLKLTDEEAKATAKRGFSGAHFPGLLRASLGMYNTTQDVNIFLEAVEAIAAGRWDKGAYHPQLSGEVVHINLQEQVQAVVKKLM